MRMGGIIHIFRRHLWMVPDATSAKEDRRSIADDDDDDDEWEVVQEIRLKRIRAKMKGGGRGEGKEEEG